jgi:hypothetical protein
MCIPTQAQVQKMAPLALYRNIIKHMKHYPSKKRFNLLLASKEEFRQNMHLKDEILIYKEIKKARIGLFHIIYYATKMKELSESYAIKPDYVESLNPKDKDFIFF